MNNSFPKSLTLAILMVALAAGCGEKKDEAATPEKSASQVAAKVNGTELTVHQVNYALQRIPNLDKEQAKPASLQVIRNLVDQEVLMQKALEDKLDRDPMVIQALDAARRQILAEAYMGKKLGTAIEPSDAEIAGYFDKHPELFTKRKLYRLQELSIKAPKEKHEEIRAQLTAAKTINDFAVWLKSAGFEVKAGQGIKPAEQIPAALLSQLSGMPDGQAIVVNSPDGLLVIVLADSQIQPVTLDQAKPAIIGMLKTQAQQKAAKAELDALKAAAKIEYMGEFVDAGKEPAAAAPAESKPASPAADASTAPAAGAAPSADAEAINKGVSGLK